MPNYWCCAVRSSECATHRPTGYGLTALSRLLPCPPVPQVVALQNDFIGPDLVRRTWCRFLRESRPGRLCQARLHAVGGDEHVLESAGGVRLDERLLDARREGGLGA